MPKLPKDYSKGLIYKMCCKDTTIKEIYVGSTTNFTQRKREHKSCCNKENNKKYNFKVYQFIRANGGWFNWNMVLIEFYPCETELELGRRENYFMIELQSSLNSIKSNIYQNSQEQRKQYYQEIKEHIAEYYKEYRENNKEKITEMSKKYREKNKAKILEKITCECGGKYTHNHKARHEKSAKHLSILEKRSLSGQGIQEILS